MHVVITGASSGIGEGLARAYAKRGAKLTLVARRTALLEKLSGELGVETHLVTADLSDYERCADWIEEAETQLGPVDVFINNAGMQIVGHFPENDHDWGSKLLHLNLHAPLRLMAAVLPGMLERGRGTIVNVASLAALAPTPAMAYYNASKAGLAAASKSIRPEVSEKGVHVVTVYPGPVTTPMAEAAVQTYEAAGHGKQAKNMPTGNVTDLAKLILTAVDKKNPRVIDPRVYHLARAFPGTTRRLLDRFAPDLGDS